MKATGTPSPALTNRKRRPRLATSSWTGRISSQSSTTRSRCVATPPPTVRSATSRARTTSASVVSSRATTVCGRRTRPTSPNALTSPTFRALPFLSHASKRTRTPRAPTSSLGKRHPLAKDQMEHTLSAVPPTSSTSSSRMAPVANLHSRYDCVYLTRPHTYTFLM